MQNRYVGDIGDYVKLGMLRALASGRRLGVAWWLFPDEDHNGDGRHVGYLDEPSRWRSFDSGLFDGLKGIVGSGPRQVSALEDAGFLGSTAYFADTIPTIGTPSERGAARRIWFEAVIDRLSDCDLIFLDPDNGLETKNFRPTSAKAGKSVSVAELVQLRRSGRTIVVYHHQTRMPGGHIHELAHWGGRLRAAGFSSVDALRAAPYSARAFFLLDADPELRDRAAAFGEQWSNAKVTWHPDLG